MKLGTGIVLVPERNPLLLAKEVSTLDLFSGGRFLFGIGAGWLREETQIMGGDFDHRWAQVRESVLAMKELWTKPAAEFHGTYYDFPPVKSFPKPAQKPHPPVILGGAFPHAARRAVRYGDGWVPIAGRGNIEDTIPLFKGMLAEAGRSLADWSAERLCLTHFGRADDPRTQLERVREALARQLEVAERGDQDAFEDWLRGELPIQESPSFVQAAQPDQLYLGLERYLSKRAEAATSA